jgi:hypothetical protein
LLIVSEVIGAGREWQGKILQNPWPFLIKHGDKEVHRHICAVAKERLAKKISEPFAQVWLPALIRFDPSAGVEAFESRIKSFRPAKRSKAVTWFANAFGDRHACVSLSGTIEI